MSKLLTSTLFLLLIIPILLPAVNSANAHTLRKIELVATIEPPSTILSGTTIEQINFTTKYEMSKYFEIFESGEYSFPEGVLVWSIEGLTTENISIYDNLGNVFLPKINSTLITNPAIENISLQASFEYKLTISLENIGDVEFDASYRNYGHYIGVPDTILAEGTVDIRIPKEYSINQYSTGCDIFSEEQHTVLRWTKNRHESLDCLVYFMPFKIEPVVRDIEFTIEALTHSPNSRLRHTFSMTYDLTGTVMIWNVSLVMAIPVSFPNNVSGVEVESVYDGQGSCQERTQPINTENDNPLGKYYVDNKNKIVNIFPRNTYQDETQKFDVTVVFSVPNNSSLESIDHDIPFWQPYKGYVFLDLSSKDFFILPLNITGNFKVTFIFPPEEDPKLSINEEVISFGLSENGRKTAIFTYSAPLDIPEERFGVIFDNISQRDFYNSQVASVYVLLVSLGAVSVLLILVMKKDWFKKRSGYVKRGLELLTSAGVLGFAMLNFKEFIFFGWFDVWVSICVTIQFSLSIIITILMVVYYKETKKLDLNESTVKLNQD